MWDLPRPGLEPVSPALAGRFSTTAPPGKPSKFLNDQVVPVKVFIILNSLTWAISVAGKEDPLPGPESGLLTLGNELSEETHVLTKQDSLLGRGTFQ